MKACLFPSQIFRGHRVPLNLNPFSYFFNVSSEGFKVGPCSNQDEQRVPRRWCRKISRKPSVNYFGLCFGVQKHFSLRNIAFPAFLTETHLSRLDHAPVEFQSAELNFPIWLPMASYSNDRCLIQSLLSNHNQCILNYTCKCFKF